MEVHIKVLSSNVKTLFTVLKSKHLHFIMPAKLMISPTVFSVTSSPNMNVTVTDLTTASVVTENVSSVSTPLLMITVGDVRPAAYESYIFLFGHFLQRTFPSFLSGAAMPRALR